VLNGYN